MKKRRTNGDDDLFVAFIKEHKENFYRLAYSYVKNQEDALDIVQDSIYKALQSLKTLDDQTAIKSWFYRIVVNTSLDFLRKHKRVSLADEDVLDYLHSGQEDHYENIDLEQAIQQLPVEYKTIIVLRYFEDLKIQEIAAVLNKNPNTIKTRLYRALELLKIEMHDESKEAN